VVRASIAALSLHPVNVAVLYDCEHAFKS
jgi:hypothetical protein